MNLQSLQHQGMDGLRIGLSVVTFGKESSPELEFHFDMAAGVLDQLDMVSFINIILLL